MFALFGVSTASAPRLDVSLSMSLIDGEMKSHSEHTDHVRGVDLANKCDTDNVPAPFGIGVLAHLHIELKSEVSVARSP